MMYKVLYIEGAGDIIGGGQISLLKLLQNIDQTVIKSILICPFKGELASHAEKLGIPFKNLPMDSPKKRLQGLAATGAEEKADILFYRQPFDSARAIPGKEQIFFYVPLMPKVR